MFQVASPLAQAAHDVQIVLSSERFPVVFFLKAQGFCPLRALNDNRAFPYGVGIGADFKEDVVVAHRFPETAIGVVLQVAAVDFKCGMVLLCQLEDFLEVFVWDEFVSPAGDDTSLFIADALAEGMSDAIDIAVMDERISDSVELNADVFFHGWYNRRRKMHGANDIMKAELFASVAATGIGAIVVEVRFNA